MTFTCPALELARTDTSDAAQLFRISNIEPRRHHPYRTNLWNIFDFPHNHDLDMASNTLRRSARLEAKEKPKSAVSKRSHTNMTTKQVELEAEETPQSAARPQAKVEKPGKRYREDDVVIDEEAFERELDEEFGGRSKRILHDDVLSFSLSDMQGSMRPIYETNQESRLLSLPAEIRNQIFEYVLGNNTVHVWGPAQGSMKLRADRKLRRSVCLRDETEEEDADWLKTRVKHETAATEQPSYDARHANCKLRCSAKELKVPKIAATDKLDLGLLLTCRQIHNEACLLPYQLNTFSFVSVIDLEAFVSHLIPSQVAAVEHLSFLFHNFNADPTFAARLKSQLSGLKSLILLVQLHDVSSPNHGARDYYFRIGDRKWYISWIEEGMLQFAGLAKEKTTVAAYNSEVLVGDPKTAGSVINYVLERWSERMEQLLGAAEDKGEGAKKEVA